MTNRRTLEKERQLLIELMKRIRKIGLKCLHWGSPKGNINKPKIVS